MITRNKLFALSVLSFLVAPGTAYAYVGPGLGAGTVAVVLGVLGSIGLWLFALLWYPFKRWLAARRRRGVRVPARKDGAHG